MEKPDEEMFLYRFTTAARYQYRSAGTETHPSSEREDALPRFAEGGSRYSEVSQGGDGDGLPDSGYGADGLRFVLRTRLRARYGPLSDLYTHPDTHPATAREGDRLRLAHAAVNAVNDNNAGTGYRLVAWFRDGWAAVAKTSPQVRSLFGDKEFHDVEAVYLGDKLESLTVDGKPVTDIETKALILGSREVDKQLIPPRLWDRGKL